MHREWEFVSEVIQEELDRLPGKEAAKLLTLLNHYRTCGRGNPSPAQIDDYGDGIYRLRHVNDFYQARAIFFASVREQGYERLIVLTIYKKEGNAVPTNVLDRARTRRAEYLRRRQP